MKTGTILLGGIVGSLSIAFYSIDLQSLPQGLTSSFQVYRQNLILKVLFTGVLVIFLLYVLYNLFQKGSTSSDTYPPAPSYCQRISQSDFEWQANVYTQLKKEELHRSPEYRETMQRKGANEESWNWQSREKLRKKMGLPPSPMSSDEELLSDDDS